MNLHPAFAMIGSVLCIAPGPTYADLQNTLILDAFEACRAWVRTPTAAFEVPGFNEVTVGLDHERGIELSFRDSGYAASFSAQFRDVGTDGHGAFSADCSLRAFSFEHPDFAPIQDAARQITEVRSRLLKNGEFIEISDPFGEKRNTPVLSGVEVYHLCDDQEQFMVYLRPPESEDALEWNFRVSLVSPTDPADAPDDLQRCSVN